MRLALAQLNTVVGDLDGNVDRISGRLEEAREAGADLVFFPELAVTGYPPEDLLLRPGFIRAVRRRVEELATRVHGITALVGAPHLDADLYNACFVLADGEIKGVYRKRFLPNYGVFDEDRYFASGNDLLLLRFGDALVGTTVCEDIWQPGPPATELALAGAQLIANISASPFHVGKDREREEMLRVRARDNSCFVALCNAVGGQDELLFDGNSVVIDDEGEVVARAPGFEEALLVVDVDPAAAIGRRLRDLRRRALARERDAPRATELDFGEAREQKQLIHPQPALPLGDLEQMRLALELGLRDYVEKNGFRAVVIGLSGGIDSALTAALAVEALGPDRVHGVSMPSRYSSEGTRGDAARLADALGIDFRELAIEPVVEAFTTTLSEPFAGRETDLTEENLQARIRGTLLMALSNKFGWLVLATGNKSELSVGYSTLYGDLAGGFALIKDVYKTDVFRLALWLNERAGRELIPASIIERPPSAELRADQLD
jgi:NAD+ synthase (glutamine-hydrolysing)